MRHRDWLLSLPLSIIVHSTCLILVAYLVYGGSVLSPLLVDLTTDPEVGALVSVSRTGPGSLSQRAAAAPPRIAPKHPPSGGPPVPRREPLSGEELAAPSESPNVAGPISPGGGEPSLLSNPKVEPPERAAVRPDSLAVPAPAGGVGASRSGIDTRPAQQPADNPGGTSGDAGRVSGAGAQVRGPHSRAPSGADDTKAVSSGDGKAASGSPSHLATAEGGGGSALVSKGGGGGGAGPEYGPYLILWRTRIHENVRYPLAARRRSLTGTVLIEIVIEPNGAVGGVKLVESSSHDILDTAVLESVRQLPPLPFPPHLVPRTIRARLPIVFELR